MRRAVAFCQVIEQKSGAKTHKVSSTNIAKMFSAVVEEYQKQEIDHHTLTCEAEHIDGGMNASEKEEKLEWLKAKTPENTCRILSNVRCLSEGVDVPALDAVLFLTPRNSQVDVVQSVGRIMRNAPNKKRGYVILPVVIPEDVEPHEALNDNHTYRVVWEVLQALRSHDDRFDGTINRLDLTGKNNSRMEVIAVTGDIAPKQKKGSNKPTGRGTNTIGTAEKKKTSDGQFTMRFEVGEIERALYAKIVKKCGNRNYWEDWAKDIAKIAQTHITRISAIVKNPKNEKESAAFHSFVEELRDDLNGQITDDEVIEMLAQHLITKPVFDALFDKYSFASHNPVSMAMQHVLEVLHDHSIDKETDTLEQFYDSVKRRAAGIDSAAAKQKIVKELYGTFFENAFPKLSEKLGIVYTPVEVVDFIIHSVNDVLQQEFGETLGSKGVHILDPFTGTGTFITRLLQSGLIDPKDLPHKYAYEIHANEIVLLAYYIAAINIEAAYHGIAGGDYEPFQGILLTDTFQLYEKDDLVSVLMEDNSARRKRQKALDIRVIIGNPPYSIGQKSENDNAANISYPFLDSRIDETYGTHSTANTTKALKDSYIRAIRWGSERIGENGVMAYVSGGAWIERGFADGMRKCLAEEYSNIYVFNLRGDVRKNMLSRGRAKEGGNIFGSGSMTGISISLFVKNPKAKSHGNIFYHDIGNELSTEDKLNRIKFLSSINGIQEQNGWQKIIPDKYNDWIGQRDVAFDGYISMGDKRNDVNATIFKNYSLGLGTNRDAWCYNSSKESVSKNMKRMIEFYNSQVDGFKNSKLSVEDFIDRDSKKISWSSSLIPKLEKLIKGNYRKGALNKSLYRPFTKQWVYYDKMFNHRVGQMQSIFPDEDTSNLGILVSGIGARAGFSAIVTNAMPDLEVVEKGQCFPLYLYEDEEDSDGGLFAGNSTGRKDGITDAGLAHFKAAYPGVEKISKEDVFYYIYGLLHSEGYREKYADNLSKQLPRIPCVKKAADFWAFSKAGRALADLHVGYESAKPYDVTLETGGRKLGEKEYYVTKMKFTTKGDKSTVVYNDYITIRDIPVEAYDYVVNGKPALEWVMERQGVKNDKDSGIVNDANLYAIETVGDAAYSLKLFQRVITVSLETLKIVRSLPKLDIQSIKKDAA
ncbi:MAG: DEAD/DEAH box helicase [Proteobacteria bacterium]|nr:DEAD/DEAH box helicase [Pseudomonadota bacterium]